MKSIIFISTNKSGSSREAIKAAEKLGYYTILFTNNEKQLEQRKEYMEVHKMISVNTNSIEEMGEEISKLLLKGIDIKTIVSFIDPFVHIASILCDKFCQNYNSSNAIKIMEDKEETRKFLADKPYTPKFISILPDDIISTKSLIQEINLPIIVKSPKSTGSKDVLLARGKAQLEKYIQMLRSKYPEETIMLEEFIEGEQCLVEAIIYKKRAHIVGIIEQEITKGKRFIITGYGVLQEVPDNFKKELEDVLHSIVTAFDIENGAMHLEIRLSESGWKLIEINPRISGGAMNKMIEAAYGFSLVEETIKLFVGEQPNLTPRHKKHVFTKYIISSQKGILEKVTGKGRASKSPGVVAVYVKPKKGTLIMPPLSMGHRYAYIIATGSSLAEAKTNANTAASEIEFHIQGYEN
ncbi:Biotin carboxylase [Psychrobacillus sp. OK028]|uniref:ATP-grasp domain-containing protein n=1 Tax=Psychrobacillus sp. OK028 TaxID=1884359 RepID=UPI00087E35C3|nr:Biotin carboxylase [Psychrobacillus sp. OK028]